jgi:hypothetical protein
MCPLSFLTVGLSLVESSAESNNNGSGHKTAASI